VTRRALGERGASEDTKAREVLGQQSQAQRQSVEPTYAHLRIRRSLEPTLTRQDVSPRRFGPAIEAVPAVAGLPGRPRRRPASVVADRGYDHDKYRRLLRERGITPVIARRQTEHGSGLGRVRWVVEQTFAHLHNFKRLLVRFERRGDMHAAMLGLACCLVCFRRLRSSI
jgi:transposase